MTMNQKNIKPFNAGDVDWGELESIGILRDELEMAGELDTLLQGKTGVISLSLVLLGVDVVARRHLAACTQGKRRTSP